MPYDDDRLATILQAGVTAPHPRRAMNPVSSDQGDAEAAAFVQDASMSTQGRTETTTARTPLWVWLLLAFWVLLVPAFLLISLGPPPWR